VDGLWVLTCRSISTPTASRVTDDLRVAWMRDPDGNILTVFQLTDAG